PLRMRRRSSALARHPGHAPRSGQKARNLRSERATFLSRCPYETRHWNGRRTRTLLRRRRDWWPGHAAGPRFLCDAVPAVLGAAFLVVRTGLERALHADGGRCLAGLEGGWFRRRPRSVVAVRRAARIQRPLELALLRLPAGHPRPDRDRPAARAHRTDDRGILARSSARRRVARPIPAVGRICHGTDVLHRAAQSWHVLTVARVSGPAHPTPNSAS